MSLSAETRARDMSESAGIQLTEDQIKNYSRLRELTSSTGNNQGYNGPPEPWKLCDKELLDTVLFPGQSVIFRSKYPNIFPPESNSTEKPEDF